MTAISPIRVGLIGYGLAGSAFHAPLVATTPGLRLSAIVTSDPARSRQAGRDHPGAEVVPDADALFRLAPHLDLVVLATPNRTHVPLALESIRAGVPVVVDKPLAPTSREALQVIEAARAAGVLCTVFQNRRWDGDFLTVRRLLGEGRLGRVHRFESRFERWRPVPKPGWRESGDPADAGGILYDLGSHLIDQATVLFGPVADVYAEVDRRRGGVEVDDDVFLALTHRSGVRSHLWMSALAAQQGPRFRLLGDAGAYVKHGLDVQEAALRAGARPADGHWGEEPRERWGVVGSEVDPTPVPTERGDYREFYRGVRAAIGEGLPPPVDPMDAVETLRVIETAFRVAGIPVRG